MARRELVLSRGEQAVLDRLMDEAEALALLSRRVRECKRRRALLIVKARHANIPARTIEKYACITNVQGSGLPGDPEARERA